MLHETPSREVPPEQKPPQKEEASDLVNMRALQDVRATLGSLAKSYSETSATTEGFVASPSEVLPSQQADEARRDALEATRPKPADDTGVFSRSLMDELRQMLKNQPPGESN